MNRSISTKELISRARAGDREALGDLLEMHRGYLKVLAQRYLEGPLEARVDASDLVQQTFLSVFRNFQRFEGAEEGEFVAWLRKVHQRNVQDAVRDHTQTAKRTLGREQRLPASSDDGPVSGSAELSPSQRAMQGEDAVRLAGAIQQLPPDQREAVRLRHLEGRSLAGMAQRLERSEEAVAGLVKRGLQNLRKILGEHA